MTKTLIELLREPNYSQLPDWPRDLLEDAAVEIERLRALMKGWSSYAWKDGEYVDDVQGYFDSHLGEAP